MNRTTFSNSNCFDFNMHYLVRTFQFFLLLLKCAANFYFSAKSILRKKIYIFLLNDPL